MTTLSRRLDASPKSRCLGGFYFLLISVDLASGPESGLDGGGGILGDDSCFDQEGQHLGRCDYLRFYGEMLLVVGHHIGVFN